MRASAEGDKRLLSARARARTIVRPPNADARSKAKTIALNEADAESVVSIMRSLPDPTALDSGTLVLVPSAIAAAPSLARSVLAVFGRTKTVPRSLRCTALVARGYVRVGGADSEDATDLTWGYAPSSSDSSREVDDDDDDDDND